MQKLEKSKYNYCKLECGPDAQRDGRPVEYSDMEIDNLTNCNIISSLCIGLRTKLFMTINRPSEVNLSLTNVYINSRSSIALR